MTDRADKMSAFLAKAGWSTAQRSNLAGDASNRRYERLVAKDGARAVLMDAPPEKGEDVRPFVGIDNHLRAQGLSAPEIFACDTDNGFLLLEDLGDDLFARVLKTAPAREAELYEAAVDVLLDLHQAAPPQDLAEYDSAVMADMAAQAWRWYRRGCGLDWSDKAAEFATKFETILAQNLSAPEVLIQRDYHAENLIWLPDRVGAARVGLLDFQDAMVGHRAYDLVSLLQDARRDVSAAVQDNMLAHYIAKSGQNDMDFRAAFHLLGLQRNLRILGIFARLSLHFGKPHYVDLIPRVWDHIIQDLKHPVTAPLAKVILGDLPAPTPTILKDLKDQCGTVPTL
ncbi:aminoglycoside phosphotransferase family protein [Cognatishimia maritima]|uniref:Aminoglycoside phosphotransferase domain-containing protein n=1 Tax=Cognatishimia maritima TaxID=870908 RepID=A0A1M5PG35_9RHOB|nr:phosphotransferase [Cognatishimia maritima]SHH00796.1 hypothetical protein SAMN04488044_1811 [Cognatishimia maritima]